MPNVMVPELLAVNSSFLAGASSGGKTLRTTPHGGPEKLIARTSICIARASAEDGDSSVVTSGDGRSAAPSTASSLALLEKLTGYGSSDEEFPCSTSSPPAADGGFDSSSDSEAPSSIALQLSDTFKVAPDATVIVPLTSNLSGRVLVQRIPKGAKLTAAQQRNKARAEYLGKVSKRNDSMFFATVGALVLGPPAIILSISVAVGYVDLLP